MWRCKKPLKKHHVYFFYTLLYVVVFNLKSNIMTEFYTDVFTHINAGMEFMYSKGGTKSNKIKKIGYDIVRIFYDTKEKDCVVGQIILKRVFNNK